MDIPGEAVGLFDHRRQQRGFHTYQARIRLTGNLQPGKTITLRLIGLSNAFEVFWDETPVGRNGTPGRSVQEEIPGNIHCLIKLDAAMVTAGDHLLTIQLSDHRGQNFFPGAWVIISYLIDWQSLASMMLYREFFMMGIYLMTVVLSLALYLGGGRHRSFLIFGSFCLLSALAYSVTALIEHGNFTVSFLDALQGVQFLHHLLTPWLWVVFLLFHLKLPAKKVQIVIVSVIVGISRMHTPLPGPEMDWGGLIAVAYAVSLTIFAIRLKRSGSVFALAGMLFLLAMDLVAWSSLILEVRYPLWREFFTVPFLFCITLSISRQIRAENRRYTAAIRRSHRLETEMLKKTIQPHFIMNTLVSVISLVGENPAQAVRLIRALADEFRLINRISAEKEIFVREEIDLCRTHLELMGYRMDARYELDAEGIPEAEKIPPMVLHTLVENALTHAYEVREHGRFRLTCAGDGNRVEYRFSNDGSLLRSLAASPGNPLMEGTGYQYIRARLEESYPGRWTLEYGLNGSRWEVIIGIEKNG
jgi:hypothetical protein